MFKNENPATPIAENTPTQTLFRFVSLRSPQLSDEKDQDKRFVLIPEELKDDNKFYKPVTEGTGTKRKLLQECAVDYAPTTECIAKDKPTNNLGTFKRTYKVLCDFATWLARNKSTCTYQEFITERDNVLANQYTTPTDTLIWNNLIYQVVTQKDFYIKEVMMQVILALHTLRNPVNSEDEAKVLLNARVVLPKELMLDEETLPVSQGASKMASAETYPTQEMKKQQEISSAKMKLSRIEALKKNLSATEKQYNKEYQAEYKLQEEGYQREIAPIIEEYNTALVAAQAEYCEVRPTDQEYDPTDPCRKPKEIPLPKVPTFEFNFRDEVSAESLNATLKPNNLETLIDILDQEFNSDSTAESNGESEVNDLESLLEGRNTFAEITTLINETTNTLNDIIIENTTADNDAYTSIGGIIVPLAKNVTVPFTFQVCPKFIYKNYTLDLALNVPDSTWDIAGMSYTLNGSNGTNISSSYFVKTKTGNTFFLNDMLFPGVDFYTIQNSSLEVSVTFTNGKTATFFVRDITARACVSSSFELDYDDGGETPVIIDEIDFIPSGFGFKQIGVADYLKVEQSTHAYVEGEVAHIENVMAREYREKSTRKLRRSENTSTTSSDTEREQVNDTTTANRFEMQTEIAKMMQEASDIGASANAHMEFTKSYTLDLGANYANHKSKEESIRQAVTQSQDITSRAMDRIVNKVHEERIEKIIEEFEESNSHGLDNRKGDKHVVGVYRWVDKLMKNQIYNYGKRMMFEFMVPEPAKLHLLGMIADKSANQTSLVKPEDPRTSTTMPLKDYSYLENDVTFKYWIAKYNVEIDEKPLQSFSIGKSLSAQSSGNISEIEFYNMKDEIQIPEGNIATEGLASFSAASDGDGANVNLLLGDLHYHFNGMWGQAAVGGKKTFIKPYSKVVPVSSTGFNEFCGTSNFIVDVVLTSEAKNAWLQKTFKTIIDAYEEALVEYNNQLAEEQNKAVVIKDSNPNFYRQIENTVLRKNCISYMADRTIDSTHGYGISGLTTGSVFGDYETNLTSRLDKYTAFVKFMEQAFEWENLSYYLYPFYWGNKQNWLDLYQSENTDPLFRAFLQSGMARVVVTVRPGFEDAVQFYMATGKIWNGGEVPVIGDDLYLSIVDEMKEPKGLKQGKAWITRLPTTLNILQAESIGLKVAHALPFTTEDPDDFEVPSEVITEDKFNFEPNDHLLGGAPDSKEKIISGDWV